MRPDEAGDLKQRLTCAPEVIVRREIQTLRLLLERLELGRLQQAGASFERPNRELWGE